MSGALMRAAEVLGRGEHPLALLDLDLTLIENAPRTRAILTEWADGLAGALPAATHGEVCERALGLPLVFSIRENLRRVLCGEDVAAIPEALVPLARAGFDLWRARFFDPALLVHDVALPGAVEAVRALVGRGVTVVYVTARRVDMAAATVDSLLKLGFPVAGRGALLLTHDEPALSDHEGKLAALEYCARLGTVVLNAENEPAHANAMHQRFPSALTVLVETRHSEPAPPLLPGVARVARFEQAL